MKILNLLSILLFTTLNVSAQLAVTIPGEFEKNNGVILAWSTQLEDNLVIAEIINLAQQETDTIWLLYQQEPLMDTTNIRQFLLDHGATTNHVKFLSGNYETPLIRNYGPISGFAAFESNLERFIYNGAYLLYGPSDEDSIPFHLAQQWNWPVVDITLEMDGSNLLHDGIKSGFSTTQLLDNNIQLTEVEIKNLLCEKYNLNNWSFLNPLTESGGGPNHSIDKFMQVIDFETLLISSYPDTLPDYATIEQNVTTLESLTNAFGQPYQIVRIPAPPRADGTFGIDLNDEMRTYTLSAIFNNQVFVPSYGLPWYDSTARAIYEQVMPGYQIHMIDATYISSRAYGLRNLINHYIQDHYLRIEHRKLLGAQPYQPDVQITCLSKAGELVEEMWLYYKLNSDTVFEKTPVYLVCPEHFGKIEGLLPTDTVHYYLEAISTTTTTTYPLSAPEGQFTFWFDIVSDLNEINKLNFSTVFPNPNKGVFTVRLKNGDKEARLQLYNLDGKSILEMQVINSQLINLGSKVNSGIYLARILSNNKEEIFKIVIQ